MSTKISKKFLLPLLDKERLAILAPEKLLESLKTVISEEKLKEVIPNKDFEKIIHNTIEHEELIKLLKNEKYTKLSELFRTIKIEKISKLIKECLPKIPDELLQNATFFEIEKTYLSSPDGKDNRVRAINNTTFVKTVNTTIPSEGESENERPISCDDYYKYLTNKVGNTIEKVRCQFKDENLNYKLDVYTDVNLNGLIIVEVEFPSQNSYETFNVPDWFGTETKVN